MEGINWLRYVREEIEERDDEKEDIYIPDKRSLKKGIRDIYQSIWGAEVYAPNIFDKENQLGELEELKEFEEVKIGYSFNVESLINSEYPCNVGKIDLSLKYNWNDYLYAWLLTTSQVCKEFYDKRFYMDIHYRMFENIPEMSKVFEGQLQKLQKISGGEIDSVLVKEEKSKKTFREMKLLYLNVEIHDKIFNILNFLVKASYYYQLDILYILEIYVEEERLEYTCNGKLFNEECEELVEKLADKNEINRKILEDIEKIEEKNCANSWYWELVKGWKVKEMSEIELPRLKIPQRDYWRMILCLLCLKNSRKIFISKDKERYDGFRYTHLQNLWKQIKEIGEIKNTELEEYYFEALTGKELCLVETNYYEKIPNTVRNNKEIEKLFYDLFDQFHTFPNICSRTIFVKEIMAMLCVFGSDFELIKSALEILRKELPEMIKAITEAMKFVVDCIINSGEYELEDLKCEISEKEISDVWKKQREFTLPKESKIDEEIYKKFSRAYIQKKKIGELDI